MAEIVSTITYEETVITAPLTVEVNTVSVPVTLVENVISVPVTLLDQSISAPFSLIENRIEVPVTLVQNIIEVPITLGTQGPQGVPGNVAIYMAGVALGGHRIVVLNNSAAAIYADNTNLGHRHKVLGMTTGATDFGASATIQTSGELTEPSWTWILDTPIFLSTNGLLTQTEPAIGFSLVVAFPITATRVFIKLQEPLQLT